MNKREYLVHTGNPNLKGTTFSYKYRNQPVRLTINRSGITIALTSNKKLHITEIIKKDWFRDAIRKASLVYLIRFSSILSVNSLYLTTEEGTGCIYNAKENFDPLVYCMIDNKLLRPMASEWRKKEVLSIIVNTHKSDSQKDRRFAALNSLLMAKSKKYESERFLYLWMTINALYGYMTQYCIYKNKDKGNKPQEYQQIRLISEYYGLKFSSQNVSKGKRSRLVESSIDFFSQFVGDAKDELINEIQHNSWTSLHMSLFNGEVTEKYDVLAFMYYWLPYNIRCKYFHGETPIAIISFANERPIPSLGIINDLLERMLDNELYKWFDEKYLNDYAIPKLEGTQIA